MEELCYDLLNPDKTLQGNISSELLLSKKSLLTIPLRAIGRCNERIRDWEGQRSACNECMYLDS